MTYQDKMERLRRAVLDAVAPLVPAVRRLLERLEVLGLRLTLRARYGVTFGLCEVPLCIDHGTVAASSPRRLSAAQVGEVRRLTARLRSAERRSNGTRRAGG